jgi:hypothetical protein
MPLFYELIQRALQDAGARLRGDRAPLWLGAACLVFVGAGVAAAIPSVLSPSSTGRQSVAVTPVVTADVAPGREPSPDMKKEPAFIAPAATLSSRPVRTSAVTVSPASDSTGGAAAPELRPSQQPLSPPAADSASPPAVDAASRPAAQPTLAPPGAQSALPPTAQDKQADSAAPTGAVAAQEAAPQVMSVASADTSGPDGVDKRALEPSEAADAAPATVAAIDPAPAPEAGEKKAESVTLEIPTSVRVRDGDIFQIGDDLYKLTTVEGLGVDKRCQREEDGRCVVHPRAALKRAIVGSTLACQPVDMTASPKVVHCSKIKEAVAVAEPAPRVGKVRSGTADLF